MNIKRFYFFSCTDLDTTVEFVEKIFSHEGERAGRLKENNLDICQIIQ